MEGYKLALIAIIILAIIYRIPALQNQGFLNTEGYIYYSIAKQTIVNNYTIPNPPLLQGFPNHNPYTEKELLIYMPIILWLGTFKLIPLIEIMRIIIPLIFIVIGIITIYSLSLKLIGDKKISLLASFIYGIMPASIFHTSFLEYIGDGFVASTIAITLLMLIAIFEDYQNKKIRFKNIIGFAGAFFTTLYLWNGGIIIVGVIGLIIGLHLIYKKNDLGTLPIFGLISIIPFMILLYEFPNIFLIPSLPLLNGDLYLMAYYLGVSVFFAIIALINMKHYRYQNFTHIVLFSFLIITFTLYLKNYRWVTLLAMPIAIYGAYGINIFIDHQKHHYQKHQWIVKGCIAIIILVILFLSALISIQVNIPPNNVTKYTFNTLNWISNNTQGNATFMAYWEDGTYIEAISNRNSYIDVFSSDAKLNNFTEFLAGRNDIIKQTHPTYLWLRQSLINVSIIAPNFQYWTGIRKFTLQEINPKIYGILKNQSKSFHFYNESFMAIYCNKDGILYIINYNN